MSEREYILNILVRVFRDGGYASLLMRNDAGEDMNMAFVSETVYGTIRNYSFLESQWRHMAKKVRLRTALLLDMTVYQMFFMDSVPDYAAVSEAASLAAKAEKGFVNAVLRRVQKEGLKEAETTALKTSHPEWLLKMWEAHYGKEKAESLAFSDQKKALVYGRLNTLKAEKDFPEKHPELHFVNDLCFTSEDVIQKSVEFAAGKVLIQDKNSQEVVRMLDVKPGMKVLDLCAAPGTKTQQIAMMMNNTGSVTACDLYPARLELIGRLNERTGVTNVTLKQNDASLPGAFAAESFDRILMDVPCSGLGDLRHKPEIRWHLKPEKLDEITSLQKMILEASCAYLKPGGIMVYSTCTLNRKENDRQVYSFLKVHPEFELLCEKTLFPDETDADGFFAAALRKKETA